MVYSGFPKIHCVSCLAGNHIFCCDITQCLVFVRKWSQILLSAGVMVKHNHALARQVGVWYHGWNRPQTISNGNSERGFNGNNMATIWQHYDQPSNFWDIHFSDKTKCDGLWCSKPSAITLDTKVIMIREYQNGNLNVVKSRFKTRFVPMNAGIVIVVNNYGYDWLPKVIVVTCVHTKSGVISTW